MRLIDVNTILDVEKMFEEGKQPNLQTRVLVDFHGEQLMNTKYAILSHCWGAAVEEVQFKEMKKLTTMTKCERNVIRLRSGYNKILDACRQAHEDQIDWVWVDTCCIHKESSTELSEAINSMYSWYASSKRCYTYLHDIDDFALLTEPDEKRFREFNGWPKWFSRGWTLQELVAPNVIHFFNRKWEFIGDKRSLAGTLYKITRVPVEILKEGLSSNRPSTAQIMSWAANRKTTREEDRAYSLLGLFGVHMPMLYGEGKNAFQRLQLEIIRMSNDHSIFAWDPKGRIRRTGSVLADDPSYFQDCHDIERMEPDEFIESLKDDIAEEELPAITDERLHSFTVTNGGIHIWLPVTSSHDRPSVFRITLACRREDDSWPVTVDLTFWKSNFYRYFCQSEITARMSEFRQLLLGYRDETCCDFTFKLDHRTISYYNFACCGTLPRKILLADNSFTLTSTDPLAVVVYANSSANAHFAVGFGSCFGQEWVHVVCIEGIWPGWENYAEAAYDQIWNAGAEHARRMAEGRSGYSCSIYQTKHVHLPQSIWAVEVVCGWGEKTKDRMVIVDVIQCTGCCRGPSKYMTGLDDVEDDHDMPGLMKPLRFLNGHLLRINDCPVHFVLAHELEKQLGDYGHILNGNLKREGNIFADLKSLAANLGIDPTDAAFHPVQCEICDAYDTNVESDSVTTKVWSGAALVLCQPVGLSLPNNQYVALLLKALSTRLAARCLVTRVIRCSTWHATTPFSPQHGTKYSEVWGNREFSVHKMA
ncbi:heterokaryon incompatibility protein-domain-containing protein [Scleroderma yunnanense]